MSVAALPCPSPPLCEAGGEGGSYSTGIWSLRWATDNTEIVAGTGDNSLYIYDVTAVGGA